MKVRENMKNEEQEENYDSLLDTKLKTEDEDLTPEDEERRRRRRERNKVAATKCRNKKKEKTVLLVSESEILENQNLNLKQEISRLEAEKRHLVDILSMHEPACAKRPRLEQSNEDDSNFRVPAVPVARGPPPRLSRQDSLLQTLEILGSLEDLVEYDEEEEENPQSAEQKSSSAQEDDISNRPFSSCSFSRSKQNYFLANNPKSLSYSGFQLDNRCIAL